MRGFLTIPSLVACLALGLSPPLAAELQVAADGSAAFETIGEALAVAVAGDTLVLAPGTYASGTNGEQYPLAPPPGVHLAGAGVDETVLDGEYAQGLLSIEWTDGDPVTLGDLTLTGGEAPVDGEGDVLYLWQAEARLERVRIEANGDPTLPDLPWNMDSWIDLRSSGLELVDVELRDNHGSHAGMECDHGTVVLDRVTFSGNYSYYGLVALTESCDGSLTDVVLVDNAGGNCEEALLAAGPAPAVNLLAAGNDVGPCRLFAGAQLVHATAVDNRAHGLLPLIEVDRLGHSIVAYNGAGVAIGHFGQAAFNTVYGNAEADWVGKDRTGQDGNLAVAPRFVAPGLDGGPRDLHLGPDSPLIDAGGELLTTGVDLEGTSRPIDGDGDGLARPDPGVYEQTFVEGDDDDSAGGDDDDGDCACSQRGPRSRGALGAIVALAAVAAIRRRSSRRTRRDDTLVGS